MKPFFAPYLLPDPGSHNFGPWERVVADEVEPLEDTIPGWAPGTPVVLRRSIELDLELLLSSSGLEIDTELWINSSWIGSQSKIRERIYRQPARNGINIVEVHLPEDRIGGTVSVQTTVVLAGAHHGSAGSATRPGSILVREETSIVLEGDSSSFPTCVVSFDETTNDSNASWHLVTSLDLEASFGGQYLLEVNEKDRALVKAIEAEKPNSEQRQMVNTMMGGVGEILLELAIRCEQEQQITQRDFSEGTVGAVLGGLLLRSGLDTAVDFTDATSAADFRCNLQGAVRRLGFGREL